MLILLRLAEDVITFQTLPTQRRRDIQQTLTQNMESIFSFLIAILHLNVEDYRKKVSGLYLKYFYLFVFVNAFYFCIVYCKNDLVFHFCFSQKEVPEHQLQVKETV